MLKINSKTITLLFVLVYIFLGAFLFQSQKRTAVQEAEKRIGIFMSKWLALFDYIEVKQKNVFYELEKSGDLTIKGYFDPSVLSFSYIARQIQKKYEEIEREKGEMPYHYRLSATSPRNPINKASKHEATILERFRNNEIDKFTEYIHRDDEKFYVSYTPISRTDTSCMRCHSTPDKAPRGLVERYGRHVGFNVPIGTIRAMIVMEIPFSEIENEALKNYATNMSILLFIFVLFNGILVALLKKEKMLSQANNELAKLSNIDKLTNIYNRRYFDKFMEDQFNIMKRDENFLSLVMCDIDHFKQYNDIYGHQAGDKCLSSIALSISNTLKRPTDIVARYGGEEFVVVLPGTNSDGALYVANLIQNEISKINISHKGSSTSSVITLSMGVGTIVPDNDNSVVELIKNADNLLYKAKGKGRNSIEH
ncbi:MAG: diguanylate cyclase [Desulfotalea sp.]